MSKHSADWTRTFLSIRLPVAADAALTSDGTHPAAPSDDLDLKALSRLIETLRQCGNAVRPVAVSSIHLTVRFLGDLNSDQIATVCDVTSRVTRTTSRFRIRMSGLGAFPNLRRPSVIWVGVEDSERCCELANCLEHGLTQAGFAAESRPFTPHFTLARVRARPPQRLFDLLNQHSTPCFGAFTVAQVQLTRSELTPTGPVYSSLAEFPLRQH